MFLLGLDAGTTSISGVLLNAESKTVDHVISVDHDAALPAHNPSLSIQDPEKLFTSVQEAKTALLREALRRGGEGAVSAISVTGQMHGILYIDRNGRSLSPLFTWQDLRGHREYPSGSKSWFSWASERTGYMIPPGYGYLTHVINRYEEMIPPDAAGLSTLSAYVSMRLTNEHAPSLEYSDAHSLGLFDLQARRFDTAALKHIGITDPFIPEAVPAGTLVGKTEEGIPVYAAVGDNQAGFIGAVHGNIDDIVVNVGTSAQVSACISSVPPKAYEAPDAGWIDDLEIRPFPGDRYLITGASISGGSSYRLLEQLFREICTKYTNTDPGNILDQMNQIPYDRLHPDLKLEVSSQFQGTRRDPNKRGAISNIGRYNLTHDYLVEGFLRGIAEEVARYYRQISPLLDDKQPHKIVGVGNAIRRNALLRTILEEKLGTRVLVSPYAEEAAYGAAFIAGLGAGIIEME